MGADADQNLGWFTEGLIVALRVYKMRHDHDVRVSKSVTFPHVSPESLTGRANLEVSVTVPAAENHSRPWKEQFLAALPELTRAEMLAVAVLLGEQQGAENALADFMIDSGMQAVHRETMLEGLPVYEPPKREEGDWTTPGQLGEVWASPYKLFQRHPSTIKAVEFVSRMRKLVKTACKEMKMPGVSQGGISRMVGDVYDDWFLLRGSYHKGDDEMVVELPSEQYMARLYEHRPSLAAVLRRILDDPKHKRRATRVPMQRMLQHLIRQTTGGTDNDAGTVE